MSKGWIKTDEQRERHKQRCREYYRKSLLANPDLNKKAWKDRKDKLIEAGQYEAYIEKQKTAVRRTYSRYRSRYVQPDQKKRIAVIEFLGGECCKCGYCADVRALVLDHKNGDGYLDRKRLGSKIARYYVDNLDEAKEKLQVLCSNCNAIKAIEENEHNRSRRITDEEGA